MLRFNLRLDMEVEWSRYLLFSPGHGHGHLLTVTFKVCSVANTNRLVVHAKLRLLGWWVLSLSMNKDKAASSG